MSHVDNWMILGPHRDEDGEVESIVSLNQRLATRFGPWVQFERVNQHAGGSKALESGVLLLAVNMVPHRDVLQEILATDWGDDWLQVLFRGQHDDEWRFLTPQDLASERERLAATAGVSYCRDDLDGAKNRLR